MILLNTLEDMGLKFGSTFGPLQVGLASWVDLHIVGSQRIIGNDNFFASVKAKIAERGLVFAPAFAA